MFRGSVNQIKEQMVLASRKARYQAQTAVDQIFETISRDYSTIVDALRPSANDTGFWRDIGAVLDRITMFTEPTLTSLTADPPTGNQIAH